MSITKTVEIRIGNNELLYCGCVFNSSVVLHMIFWNNIFTVLHSASESSEVNYSSESEQRNQFFSLLCTNIMQNFAVALAAKLLILRYSNPNYKV